MLKVLLNVIKYILLTIDFIIISIVAIFYSCDFYRRCIGEKVVLNDAVYDLSDFLSPHERGVHFYGITIFPKKKSFCDKQEFGRLLFNIPKIYKIYKESNMLVVVVPKDMDTTNLDLYIKKNFYERKVSDNVIRDYYKGVKRPGIKAVDLIVEYVDKE